MDENPSGHIDTFSAEVAKFKVWLRWSSVALIVIVGGLKTYFELFHN